MLTVASLCQNNTGLRKDEIVEVEKLAYCLQYIADLTRADIFIDVMTGNEDEALVVAEANPATAPSLYTKSVVGELALKQNEPAVIKSFNTGRPVREVKGVTQQGVPVKQTVIPVRSHDNQAIATLIMEQDITEQIQTEAKVELLSETTEKLTSALLDVATMEEVLPTILEDAVVITNADYSVLYANQQAQRLIRAKPAVPGRNLMDSIIEFVGSPDIGRSDYDSREMVIDDRTYVIKHVPFKKGNRLATHIFLLRDITELRNKEKELMVKAAVIKEIHHRVKNNLHTVASLLRLQMRRSGSQQVKKEFLTSVNRISSIALIHEALAVEDLYCIDLLPLVKKVAGLSIKSAVDTGDRVTVNVTGNSLHLPSELATATAMVLNELIQNAIEHGFGQNPSGNIDIDIDKQTNFLTIKICDNGCGLPEGFSIAGCAGLGLTIVDSIVREKLGGTISFVSGRGTTVVIDFPLPQEGECLCTA